MYNKKGGKASVVIIWYLVSNESVKGKSVKTDTWKEIKGDETIIELIK